MDNEDRKGWGSAVVLIIMCMTLLLVIMMVIDIAFPTNCGSHSWIRGQGVALDHHLEQWHWDSVDKIEESCFPLVFQLSDWKLQWKINYAVLGYIRLYITDNWN